MFKRFKTYLGLVYLPNYSDPYAVAQKANEDVFWLLNCAGNVLISDSDRILIEQARIALIRVADKYPEHNY